MKARWSWSSASLPAPFICLVAADRGQLAARPCAWLGNVINKGNVTLVGEADFHDYSVSWSSFSSVSCGRVRVGVERD